MLQSHFPKVKKQDLTPNALFHTGFMSATKQTLDITIVEGSGSGELCVISGSLTIKQENGQHYYELDYKL